MVQSGEPAKHLHAPAASQPSAEPAVEQARVIPLGDRQPARYGAIASRSESDGYTGQITAPQAPVPETLIEPGTTTVADSVVAQVAAIAARNVPGVHELVSRGSGDALMRFFQRLNNPDKPDLPGVTVKVGRQDVVICLTMTVDYGVSIPLVVDAVRRNVMDSVQTMTGLTVKAVKIDVLGLHFPEEGDR